MEGSAAAGAAVAGNMNEAEAKSLLAEYGVPVVAERIVVDAAEAVAAAAEIGYPVVLKGLGRTITHKTERGLVELGLADAAAVAAAAERVGDAARDELEGLLVQRQVAGRRELVAGLLRDPVFGPVVMFGLGGVFTEALGEVTFRLAPLTAGDAREMLAETGAAALLGELRGERAADADALIGCLLGLSRLAEEHPEVLEVDVNPLVVGADGSITAVDALVRRGRVQDGPQRRPRVPPRELGALFYPRSIAFIGASSRIGSWGHMLLTNVISGGFARPVYLVNPKGGSIAGRPVYRSIAEVPDEIDLAVVTVPAAAIPGLVPELRDKGVRGMVVVSSGFAETGDEGRPLEEELVGAAAAAGIVVIGPNTMGTCNPHRSFYCTGTHVRPVPGSTTLVAQSGNMGTQLLAFAVQQGIGIRAFCGSGNEAMVSIEDYMEAFEVDELTETVVLYLEGLRDGRRFFSSAARVGRSKPVVVLKGGRTAAGARAAASHTGALASDTRLFSAACRQAGVVEVRQPMELLDLSAAFSSLPLPRGSRVGVVTLGGGWGVVTADLCAEHGLEVAPLDPEIVARIDRVLPPFWSRANPVDLVGQIDPDVAVAVTAELAEWNGCDAVINLGIVGQRQFMRWLLRSIRDADPAADPADLGRLEMMVTAAEAAYVKKVVEIMERCGKPIIGVKLLEDDSHRTLLEVPGHRFRGVFFQTPERAVRTLARMSEYHAWRCRQVSDPRDEGFSWGRQAPGPGV